MTNKKNTPSPSPRRNTDAEDELVDEQTKEAAEEETAEEAPAAAAADNEPDEREESFRELPPSERGSLQLYLHEIGRVALLTAEQEVELAARIKNGDGAAREQMIRANLRLVVKIAHDYSHFGLPLLDLISEGNIGLMKAVERFDPAKGGKLSTYAAWWIKQSIKRALANQSKTIRLPVHMVDKLARLRKTTAQMQETLGREPSNEELAEAMGLPVKKIAHLKTVSMRPSSLDAPVGENDSTELGELVCDENEPTPFENLRGKTTQQDISAIVSKLDPRETEILRLRFGLDGERPKTLEDVGLCLGVTRERVRQLQNSALAKMRKALMKLERQNTAEEAKDELSEAAAVAAGTPVRSTPTPMRNTPPAQRTEPAPARADDTAALYAFMRSQREKSRDPARML
ncbi:MAG TPA: sigma-70 family RNA polymerase sigma factor [Opitutales bacterium]|nr:sigma-70 family RNA polymerase sigma factor [Opitutales bacterium]